MMTTLDILIAARAKITDPKNWWDGKLFSSWKYGRTFCAAEAIGFCGETTPTRIVKALNALAAAAGIRRKHIPVWNDASDRTHEHVMAAFNRAIASERASRTLASLLVRTDQPDPVAPPVHAVETV